MKRVFKFAFNNMIDFIRIVFCVVLGGFIAISFGKFGVWLYGFINNILNKILLHFS